MATHPTREQAVMAERFATDGGTSLQLDTTFGEAWFAVQTRAKQEAVAVENLERQGFITYCPTLKTARRVRGRHVSRIEPLFPGYVFVQVDPTQQSIAPIRSTRGAVGVVRFAGQPATVPDALIARLKAAHGMPQAPIVAEELFRDGETVQVVEGPLAGLSGIFKARSGEERVCVLLSMLGKTQEVKLSMHQVVPARMH